MRPVFGRAERKDKKPVAMYFATGFFYSDIAGNQELTIKDYKRYTCIVGGKFTFFTEM